MEGDGKTSNEATSTDNESLPPLTHADLDVIHETDFSTGYNCLKFMMVNRFMRDRLGLEEYSWLYKSWRNQIITFTRKGVNESLHSESHEPNRRQAR